MPEPFHAFPDPVQDKLLGLILALGAEVWVLKDRLALLEEALSTRGISVSDLIEELAKRPERVATIEQERNAFMERFLRILTMEVKG
ncbi:MAG: hypothetical protein HY686_02450 [Chloroflexi bacterium]|nr:hypothetical protein [Chloroflexota bacterium]